MFHSSARVTCHLQRAISQGKSAYIIVPVGAASTASCMLCWAGVYSTTLGAKWRDRARKVAFSVQFQNGYT